MGAALTLPRTRESPHPPKQVGAWCELRSGDVPGMVRSVRTLRSDLRADFARTRDPFGRMTLLAFRLNQAARRSRLRRLLVPPAGVLDVLWIRLLMGAELPGRLDCGPGLWLHHGGRGVIINGNCRIGADVVIYHRVTLGQSGPDPMNVPTVGDGVYFGAGATVVGGVKLGDGCKVGAGAVVVRDVPAGATAAGVPARLLGESS